jgi:hypothetical protein
MFHCFQIVFFNPFAPAAMHFCLVARGPRDRGHAAFEAGPEAHPAGVPSFWRTKFDFMSEINGATNHLGGRRSAAASIAAGCRPCAQMPPFPVTAP